MKVLLVNGSPHEKGCTYTALKEVAKELENEGIVTCWQRSRNCISQARTFFYVL